MAVDIAHTEGDPSRAALKVFSSLFSKKNQNP